MTATLTHRQAVVVTEVEWLIGTDGVERIARRLGYSSPTNLARVLHGVGRHDLARSFDIAERVGRSYATRRPTPLTEEATCV